MVFCYYMTETPQRSTSLSPRRRSPQRCPENMKSYSSGVSEFVRSFDYEVPLSKELLCAIPDRDWKLLAALAKKRDEHHEREMVADQYRKLWEQEDKNRRKMDNWQKVDIPVSLATLQVIKAVKLEAETELQYQKYLRTKRDVEQRLLEGRRINRTIQYNIQRKQLLDSIKYKEMRSAELLANIDDKKASYLVEKALIEEGRSILAEKKREKRTAIEEWCRKTECEVARRRARDAEDRRRSRIKDATQRLAINNALHHWETSMARQELTAMDATRRAMIMQHVLYEDARSRSFERNRDRHKKRSRSIAAAAARLRDMVRGCQF